MEKIPYRTPYADGEINGYVMAELVKNVVCPYYKISKRQYNRAVKKLTIGGVGPEFLTDIPVRVEGINL